MMNFTVLPVFLNKFIIFFLLFSTLIVYGNETVTIVDEDGNVKICSVTPNGVIVCL